MQTSGGVKLKSDVYQEGTSTAAEAYVLLKSVNAGQNTNNVRYLQEIVNAQSTNVQELKLQENLMKPELIEALKRSRQFNNWAPLK